MFVYKLSGCGFESYCSHLDFRYHACFKQEVPWDSGNYRVWIPSETCTWRDRNIYKVKKVYFQTNLQPMYTENQNFLLVIVSEQTKQSKR